jgi:hypothetical protein
VYVYGMDRNKRRMKRDNERVRMKRERAVRERRDGWR